MVLILVLFLDFGWGAPVAASNPVDLPAAKIAFSSKDYTKVIEIISPNLEVASREAILLLVKAYSAQNSPAMAQKTLAIGRSRFPDDPEFPTELGRVLLSLNKDREAKTTLKEVLELHPKYEPAYLVMGEMYEKKKNKYELRLLYQDLLQNLGPKTEYLTKLCDLTTLEGLYDLAFKYCAEASQKNPREPLNYVNIGNAFKETGNMPEANRNYKKAADSFSKSEPAQFTYAQFLDDQKKHVEAFQYYKKASVADEKSLRGWMGLGFAALEVQKFQESLSAFQKVCELDRNGIKHVRKAAGIVKTLNLPNWMKKYEDLIRQCEGLTPSGRFL